MVQDLLLTERAGHWLPTCARLGACFSKSLISPVMDLAHFSLYLPCVSRAKASP